MRVAFVIAVALAAGGCRDKELAQLEAIRDEVCACKTPSCGEEALKRVPQHDVKSNHRSQKAAKAMHECMAQLYLKARPSTDPDDEKPDSGSAAPLK